MMIIAILTNNGVEFRPRLPSSYLYRLYDRYRMRCCVVFVEFFGEK